MCNLKIGLAEEGEAVDRMGGAVGGEGWGVRAGGGRRRCGGGIEAVRMEATRTDQGTA